MQLATAVEFAKAAARERGDGVQKFVWTLDSKARKPELNFDYLTQMRRILKWRSG